RCVQSHTIHLAQRGFRSRGCRISWFRSRFPIVRRQPHISYFPKRGIQSLCSPPLNCRGAALCGRPSLSFSPSRQAPRPWTIERRDLDETVAAFDKLLPLDTFFQSISCSTSLRRSCGDRMSFGRERVSTPSSSKAQTAHTTSSVRSPSSSSPFLYSLCSSIPFFQPLINTCCRFPGCNIPGSNQPESYC